MEWGVLHIITPRRWSVAPATACPEGAVPEERAAQSSPLWMYPFIVEAPPRRGECRGGVCIVCS